MTTNSRTKNIKIFLSSTFRDMDAERDAIMNRVRPMVAERLKGHGMTVDFIDLRWGVSTQQVPEEEREGHVLRECLTSIQESRPFFIALLGDRYGWVPEQQSWDAIVGGMSGEERDFINDATHEARSVTELEILFGALMHTDSLQRSFFCLRDDDVYRHMGDAERQQFCEQSDTGRQRLKQLKTKIADTLHAHRLDHNLTSYSCQWDGHRLTGLDSLVEWLTSALLQEILLYESEDSAANYEDEYQQLRDLTLRRIGESNDTFCGREEWLQWLGSYIDGHDRSVLMLTGLDGMGKTALLCRLYAWLDEREGYVPYFYFADHRDADADATMPLKCWLADGRRPMRHYCGTDTDEEFGLLAHALGRTFQADGRKSVLLVDDLTALDGWQRIVDKEWVPQNTVVICATPNVDDDTFEGTDAIELQPLTPDEASALVRARLRKVRKQLPEAVLDALTGRATDNGFRPSSVPLWDVMMVRRLVLLGASYFEAQRSRSESSDEMKIQNSLLELALGAETVPNRLFATMIDDGGDIIDPHFAREVLAFIAVSEFGLRDSDLEALMGDKWDTLKWTEVKNFLGPLLSTHADSGVTGFAYPVFHAEVCRMAGGDIGRHLMGLTKWLAQLAEDGGTDPVACRELPYLAMKTMAAPLTEYVTKNTERRLRRATLYALADTVAQRWDSAERWMAEAVRQEPEEATQLLLELMKTLSHGGADRLATKVGAVAIRTLGELSPAPDLGAALPLLQAFFAECLYRSADYHTAWAWADYLVTAYMEHDATTEYKEVAARAVWTTISIWHDCMEAARREGKAVAPDAFKAANMHIEDLPQWAEYALRTLEELVVEDGRTDLVRLVGTLAPIYAATEAEQEAETFSYRMFVAQTLDVPEWTLNAFFRIRPLLLAAGRMRSWENYVASTLKAEAHTLARLLDEAAPGNALFESALQPAKPADPDAADELSVVDAAEQWLYLHADEERAVATLALAPQLLDDSRTDLAAIRAHTLAASTAATCADDVERHMAYSHTLMKLYPHTGDETLRLAMNDNLRVYVAQCAVASGHGFASLADICYTLLLTEYAALCRHGSSFGSEQALRLQVTFYQLCSMSDFAIKEMDAAPGKDGKGGKGDTATVLQRLQKAIALMKDLGLSNVLVVQGCALAYSHMAYAYEQHGDKHLMMFFNKRYEYATREAYRLDSGNFETARRYAAAMDETGRLFYMVLHNRREAEPCFRKAYALFEKLYGERKEGTIVNDLLLSTYNQTLLLAEDNRHEELCQLVEHTLQTVDTRRGDDGVDIALVATLHESYGTALSRLALHDKAERQLRKAKQIYADQLRAAPDSEKRMRDLSICCTRIAEAMMLQGSEARAVLAELDEGEQAIRRALQLMPDSVKVAGNYVALLRTKLEALLLTGDAEGVIDNIDVFNALTLQRAVEKRDTTLVSIMLGTYSMLTNIATDMGWTEMATWLRQVHATATDVLVRNRLIRPQQE